MILHKIGNLWLAEGTRDGERTVWVRHLSWFTDLAGKVKNKITGKFCLTFDLHELEQCLVEKAGSWVDGKIISWIESHLPKGCNAELTEAGVTAVRGGPAAIVWSIVKAAFSGSCVGSAGEYYVVPTGATANDHARGYNRRRRRDERRWRVERRWRDERRWRHDRRWRHERRWRVRWVAACRRVLRPERHWWHLLAFRARLERSRSDRRKRLLSRNRDQGLVLPERCRQRAWLKRQHVGASVLGKSDRDGEAVGSTSTSLVTARRLTNHRPVQHLASPASAASADMGGDGGRGRAHVDELHQRRGHPRPIDRRGQTVQIACKVTGFPSRRREYRGGTGSRLPHGAGAITCPPTPSTTTARLRGVSREHRSLTLQ